MEGLKLEVRVSRTPELNARAIELATHALSAGDRAGAEKAYQAAVRAGLLHPASWSNLAALGVALGDVEGACRHAQRAVRLASKDADAWVNFGVASWYVGRRRDAAQAMHHALALSPGLEAAAINYNKMLLAVARVLECRHVLDRALVANPRAWRLRLAAAEAARLHGDADATRQHALAALALLWADPAIGRGALRSEPVAVGMTGQVEADGSGVLAALLATHAALTAGGQAFHLVGGTLLSIWREGNLFPNDKDIDLGLPWEADRDAVAAMFAHGFRPLARSGSEGAAASREWTMGYVHDPTGIGIDLFFVQRRGDCIYNEVGWPDHLASEVPAYTLQPLHWEHRDWWVPSPPERYLEGMYGHSWRTPARYFDTQLSSPSCTKDALPRAINLALLRLLHALQERQWARAHALAAQIIDREQLPGVVAVHAGLHRDLEVVNDG